MRRTTHGTAYATKSTPACRSLPGIRTQAHPNHRRHATADFALSAALCGTIRVRLLPGATRACVPRDTLVLCEHTDSFRRARPSAKSSPARACRTCRRHTSCCMVHATRSCGMSPQTSSPECACRPVAGRSTQGHTEAGPRNARGLDPVAWCTLHLACCTLKVTCCRLTNTHTQSRPSGAQLPTHTTLTFQHERPRRYHASAVAVHLH